MQNTVRRGHKADFFMFASQGKSFTETFTFDEPVRGNRIIPVKKTNNIYNYLSNNIGFSIVPYYLVKNRKYLIGFLAYFKNILILRNLSKRVKSVNYDIIYVVVNEEHDAIFCKILKKRGFNNVIITYHEVVQNHLGVSKLKGVVKETINLGYPVIVHSDNVKKKLCQLAGSDNVFKMPFGTMEPYLLYDRKEPMINGAYILYIGSIHPYKGLSFLYQALKETKDTLNYRIVVAGRGNDPIIDKMKSDEKYYVINRYISDKDFSTLVKYAKCIICPYVAGSQSGIPSVAMLYGTPVIATKTAAFTEYIENGVNGLLIDYGDEKGLLDAISYILGSEKKVCSQVPEQLKWDNIISNLEIICKEQVLPQNRNPSAPN